MTMGIYPDDPDGPETFEEALEAFRASLRDLWHVAGVPVAQAAADRLQAGVETWRAWWKPMDLSGPWTAGWTPDQVLLAEIWKEIWEGIKDALGFNRPPPGLRGLRFETNTYRMGVDLPPGMSFDEYAAAHRLPDPSSILPLTIIDPARFIEIEDAPDDPRNRAFQDSTTGEWMVDDGEDALDEEARDMVLGNLRRGLEDDEDEDSPWGWP